MAFESTHITAACVEATEFMELSRRYRVTGVPKTMINGKSEILGAVPEDMFVRAVVGANGNRESESESESESGI